MTPIEHLKVMLGKDIGAAERFEQMAQWCVELGESIRSGEVDAEMIGRRLDSFADAFRETRDEHEYAAIATLERLQAFERRSVN